MATTPKRGARPRHTRRSGRAALQALASPARQELLAALDGRASVRELAARLGRSRQALHYHVAVLEKAGLIRAAEWRGEGRDREAVYEAVADALTVGAHAISRTELDAGERAARAMLRLTGRELARALPELRAIGTPGVRELMALRGKARLTPAKLARANALIDELLALFGQPPPDEDAKLYALTLVLTPSRDASTSGPPRRRPARRRRNR